jgi:flavin-dependent dehydrogenase
LKLTPCLGDGFTIAQQVVCSFGNWPYLAEKNEQIAFHPWIAWYNLKGERRTEPKSLESKVVSQSQGEDKKADSPHEIYRHSRPKFHLMLETQLEQVGLKVQYGKRAIRYLDGKPEDNKHPGVELDNGDVLEADLVIAADGIGSHSTKVTLGYEVAARSTGFSIYRATLPVKLMHSDSELMEKFTILPNGHPLVQLWLG